MARFFFSSQFSIQCAVEMFFSHFVSLSLLLFSFYASHTHYGIITGIAITPPNTITIQLIRLQSRLNPRHFSSNSIRLHTVVLHFVFFFIGLLFAQLELVVPFRQDQSVFNQLQLLISKLLCRSVYASLQQVNIILSLSHSIGRAHIHIRTVV